MDIISDNGLHIAQYTNLSEVIFCGRGFGSGTTRNEENIHDMELIGYEWVALYISLL